MLLNSAPCEDPVYSPNISLATRHIPHRTNSLLPSISQGDGIHLISPSSVIHIAENGVDEIGKNSVTQICGKHKFLSPLLSKRRQSQSVTRLIKKIALVRSEASWLLIRFGMGMGFRLRIPGGLAGESG